MTNHSNTSYLDSFVPQTNILFADLSRGAGQRSWKALIRAKHLHVLLECKRGEELDLSMGETGFNTLF